MSINSLKPILYFTLSFLIVILFERYSTKPKEELFKIDDRIAGDKIYDHKKISYNFDVRPILSDKCFTCHGPDSEARQANFRLDIVDDYSSKTTDSLHKIIDKDDPNNSAIIKRIFSEDGKYVMPPPDSNLSLTNEEKQILKIWIEQGAEWQKHWAYIVPKKAKIEQAVFEDWEINEIDRFVAREIKNIGLTPNNISDKERLIRRVYFDLTGLPPSIEKIDDFLSDHSSNSYEKIIDELLNSVEFGERMASIWLDIARYADTNGYQDDWARTMWPWRDWVINAFNKNIPYDQFITWQLAGDLIEDGTKEQLLATGFNRNHRMTQEGGAIDEEYRVEYVADRTVTTAKALMGLTVECARCHDHKYDAISQKDFFSLYSFFNNLDEVGVLPITGFNTTPKPKMRIDHQVVKNELSFVNLPDSIPMVEVMIMEEVENLRNTYVLNRGSYDSPVGEIIKPDTPASVLNFSKNFKKNRLGLSEWFFDPTNPLTARVTVNRIWQQFFGKGLVSTPDDFGNQGSLPTHPELLDWLSVTFSVDDKWDTKKFMKRILLSATYRQSSNISKRHMEIDPENKFLARFPRNKLPAEMLRDNALFVSGLLVKKLGGPSVKPPQPKGLWSETASGGQGALKKYVVDSGEGKYRRSLYTYWKRTAPPPNMMTFDASTREICSVNRQSTSTPLQSLVLLNDPQFYEAALSLVNQINLKGNISDKDFIVETFRRITSRIPDKKEVEVLIKYLKTLRKQPPVKDIDAPYKIDKETNYKVSITLLIFNLDETIVKS